MSSARPKEKLFLHGKRRKTNRPKLSVFAAYGGVFVLIVSIIAVGYQPPQPTAVADSSVANTITATPLATPDSDAPSVDQLVATDVAANIAQQTNMPVADYIVNASQSFAAESALAQTNSNAIVKPQVVQPLIDSRGITTYIVKKGDTVQSIAAKFDLTAQTIRWANGITGTAVKTGKKLTIPPVDGVIYTVKSGDTLANLAANYKADASRIVSFNNLEISGLKSGMRIVIPNGTPYVPQTTAPVTSPTYGIAQPSRLITSFAGGNGYAFGNCTWYAYNRRVQLGLPVGSNWGNAATWALFARAAGLRVDHTPSVGAIVQWNSFAGAWIGYAGHVGIVEAVNGDGSIVISEMNNYAYGGFDVVDRRTLSPSEVSQVSNFIH